MAYVLNYCINATDSKLLEKGISDAIALASDDEWTVESCFKLSEYIEKYKIHAQTDISCFDVTTDGSIETLEELRKNDKSTMLVLVSDTSVSPLKYMKPSLMASALILKPLKDSAVFITLKDVLNVVCSANEYENDENRFCVETKAGKDFIPFDKILYFEAREKKIFVNTLYEEFSFYSSLEILEKTLPENFVRCHRGFIVNKKKITRIMFSQNTICFGEKIIIPLSRSYKSALKEITESGNYGK